MTDLVDIDGPIQRGHLRLGLYEVPDLEHNAQKINPRR